MKLQTLHDRQAMLLARYRGGDKKAHAALIETMQGMAIRNADRIAHIGVEREELKAEAIAAICEAVEVWDPARGRLAACCAPRIRNRLLELARSSGNPVNSAKSRRDKMLNYHLARKVNEIERLGIGHHDAVRAAAEELGVSADLAARALAMRAGKCIHQDEKEGENGWQLVDNAPPVEETISATQGAAVVRSMLSGLDDIEQALARKYAGLSEESLDEIAARFDMSRDRITRRRDVFLRKMKEAAEKAKILPEDF